MPITTLVKKIFGSRNQRQLKQMSKIVAQINALEPTFNQLSDDALKAKTPAFKEQLQGGASLDDILPMAFATVREAARRVLGMRHFDVQLLGGMGLHYGRIAEMHTGEGKTLVATLPAYLNALTGRGVHVVTVNDYLARRDAEWMRPVYEFLGLTLGISVSGLSKEEKQAAYNADITYGTNNEYGFDYLRDNMVFQSDEKVQRGHYFAIIDEVDSILIDEARTPLIISGPTEDSSSMYIQIDRLIPRLTKQQEENGPGDYSVDEKSRQVFLTEQGNLTIEKLLVESGILENEESLYAPSNISLLHHINVALRAHVVFHRDVDYIVKDDSVIIVDEHTGRTMAGRRWSDGLHQAIEAKERVSVRNENQTLASITFQNYFRIYDKLSGMTGTADTEAYEFHQIYGLEVLVIPTNKPNKRTDEQDLVFLTAQEKFEAVIAEIKESVARCQPVLVGTASIETSEYLSSLLNKAKIPHQVLNAKLHAQEANIIAQAGRPGTVTIATNMAGRGTDIVLGGSLEAELAALDQVTPELKERLTHEWQERHDKVLAAGGLYVIGSERHESRRIDNQLRGRSARQGDPGRTRFYLSLDDDLMRRFAKPGMVNLMRKLHTEPGVPLQSSLLSKGIENAQRKVEGHNFDIRKNLLEFDDVANEQRKVIYTQRQVLMQEEDVSESIDQMRTEVFEQMVQQHIPENTVDEQWTVTELEQQLKQDFALELPISTWLHQEEALDQLALLQRIVSTASDAYKAKSAEVPESAVHHIEKAIMLQCVDNHWKDHLAMMDHLRQAISLRGYAQKDPKQEYKREAFNLFSSMLDRLKYEIVSTLSKVQIRQEENPQQAPLNRSLPESHLQYQHEEINALEEEDKSGDQANSATVHPFTRAATKQGRNEPCHCGSGKKFKHCHGRL